MQAFLFVSGSVAVLVGVLALAAAILPWPGRRNNSRATRGQANAITSTTFSRHSPLSPRVEA